MSADVALFRWVTGFAGHHPALDAVMSAVANYAPLVVVVPALLFLARMSPQTATGTSLAAMVLPVGALGAYEYYKEGHLQIGPSL